MADERPPLGQTASGFFRSRVKASPEPSPDAEMAAAHGYEPPQPPPGTDPRLWCSIHHRAMVITRPPERRLHCPHCLPAYQLAGSNGGRVSVSTGLRCARIKCFQIARYDLWGVPVCSPKCVALIGEGNNVRLLGCVLRVVAFPVESGRWVVVAFYASGIARGGFNRPTIRIHWWIPRRRYPGATLLRMPEMDAMAQRRKARTGSTVGCVESLDDDDVCGYFLGRLARSLTTSKSDGFQTLRLRLADWRRGRIPRPWIDTTLEPAIRHAADLLARVPALRDNRPRKFQRAGASRPTLKPAEEGKQYRIGGAVVSPELWGELTGKALHRDAQRRRLPLPEQPKRAAPDQRLDDDEGQLAGDDQATPQPKADAG